MAQQLEFSEFTFGFALTKNSNRSKSLKGAEGLTSSTIAVKMLLLRQDGCESLDLLLLILDHRDCTEDTFAERRATHRSGHRQDVVLDLGREAKQP